MAGSSITCLCGCELFLIHHFLSRMCCSSGCFRCLLTLRVIGAITVHVQSILYPAGMDVVCVISVFSYVLVSLLLPCHFTAHILYVCVLLPHHILYKLRFFFFVVVASFLSFISFRTRLVHLCNFFLFSTARVH